MDEATDKKILLASRRIKLRHFSVLLAVIEQGSMVKAAESLSITQPVVSKAIADLEQIVGVRLLDRTSEGVQPTMFGHALYKRGVVFFDALRLTMSELWSLADPEVGHLRIGASESIATTLLPAIVGAMTQKYPGVTLDIVFADANALIDRELRGRHVDLVIGRTAQIKSDDLDIAVLVRDRLHIVAGAKSPLARRRRISLRDLVDELWVLPNENNPIRIQIVEAFKARNLVPPRNAITVASPVFTRRLIAGNQHIGALGSLFLSFEATRFIKKLPIDLPLITSPVSVVTLRNRVPNPTYKLFLNVARDVAASVR